MQDYRGEFEVHVTVRPATPARLDEFRDWCRAHEFKCVRILLAHGEHVEQPMATWRRFNTTLPLVVDEAYHCAANLDRAAIHVVRVKVEADPHNDGVPEHDADAATQDPANYFEHHVKLLREATSERDRLLHACLKHGAHLSRNAWREVLDGQEERFVTLRSYNVGRTSSERLFQDLLGSLNELGEQVIEIESEYCVYDSNLDLDRGWLNPT